MPEVHEGELNVRIADLLSSFGLDCRPERPVHGRRPDIRCFYNGLRIAIEASYDRSDAEKDAIARVEQGLADIAVALHYAEKYYDVPINELEEKLRASRFNAKIIALKELTGLDRYIINRVKVARSQGGWFTNIGLEALVDIIRHASAYLINEEEVEREVDNVKKIIDDFVKVARSVDTNQVVSGRITEILYRLYGFDVAQAKDVDIVFSQAALAILLSTVFYERMRAVHNLKPVDEYIKVKGPIAGLKDALEEMLRIDYEPALKVAHEVLATLSPTLAQAVKELVDTAIRISQMPHLLARDFAGRVYHEITGNIAVRKGFATFYTEVPAAYLLASLALRTLLSIDDLRSVKPEDAGKIIDRVRGLKIADFACGSGTLLTASLYNASRITRTLCFMHDLECPSNIERELIEGGIYGLDALRYAAQITAINLALMSPEPVSRENVYAVYLGMLPNKGAWLGSLELLQNGRRVGGILQWIEGGLKGAVEEVSVTSAEGRQIELPGSYDLIIMNPPFTRATGRVSREFEEGQKGFFGFITDENTRKIVDKRYDKLRDEVRNSLIEIAEALFKTEENSLKNLSILSTYEEAKKNDLNQYYSIGQAGEGLLFLYLAYKYVKPGGVIAFVLPRNVLSGVSWFLARALLASKFHLKYIIVSTDGEGGYNFSEGTSLSESLIIAKRIDEHSDDEETIFVNLLKKPKTPLEAILTSERILSEVTKGDHGLVKAPGAGPLIIGRVKRSELLRNLDNLNRFVAAPEPEVLNMYFNAIEHGDLGIPGVNVPITRFYKIISTIGIDRHQFHDLFKPTETETPYPVVYGGEEDVRERPLVEPNHYVEPKNQRGVDAYGKFAGRVLVPDRMRFNTAHVTALYSRRPVISNIFYAVRLNVKDDVREASEKAVVYWLNTTWGLLTILINREETEGAFTSLKMTQWKLLPTLDIARLDKETLERLAKAFDEASQKTPRRIPEQYPSNPDAIDTARLEIDLNFLKAIKPNIDNGEARKKLLKIYGKIATALRHWTARDKSTKN